MDTILSMKYYFFTLFAIMAISLSSFANEIYTYSAGKTFVELEVFESNQVLTVKGPFLRGDFKKSYNVLSQVKKNKNIFIDLSNMYGGHILNIKAVVRLILNQCPKESCLIKTFITKNSECSSYCLILYMLGTERYAYANSGFGFHAAHSGFFKSSYLMKRELEKIGVDKSWILNNKELFQSKKTTYKIPKEIEGSNIVTSIIDQEIEFNF